MKLLDKEVDNRKILVAIFLFGVFLRVIRLFYEPVGINQDEAYAGYEAWALLNYGIDSNGYSWPIYFTSWGSGMNVLYSYLSIPFIAIFGLNEFSVKIAQVLFACLSIPLFYKVINNFCDDTMSLLGTLIFAINPWHITMAQWGLESNLAPFFLLALTYYLMKYFEAQRVKYIILAGLFGGLSLYTYAPLWLFVPAYIILLFAYALWARQIKIRKEYFLFAAILFVFALPLILFLMVQYDIIPEGKILCFSIPKMYYFRNGEVGDFNKENFESFLMMLLKQNGYPGENATKTVGDYYLIFAPFIIIGFLRCIKRLILGIKRREFNFESLIGLWFLISFALASNISYINTNKANYIHIPIIIFSITGIETVLNKLPWLSKITAFTAILAFFVFIIPFLNSDTQLHYSLTNDYSQVFDYTEKYIEENDVKVYLDNAINPIQYSHLFYHTKPAPAEVVKHLEKTWYGLGENYKNYYFAHNDIISFEDRAIYVYPKEWEGYITYNFSVEKIFETSSEYVIFKKIS